MIAFRSCFNSISPPFVASCTARVGSHAQQRFCQAVWMYCRPTLSQPEIPNPKLQYQGGSKRQYLNRRPISGQPCVDRKFQIRSSNNHCLVMSATADPSCSELSEALQRNAKHEARLSNISDLCSFAACENKSRSSLTLRMTSVPEYLDVSLSGLKHHASITTGVPSSTISNNSITSSLRIRTQP